MCLAGGGACIGPCWHTARAVVCADAVVPVQRKRVTVQYIVATRPCMDCRLRLLATLFSSCVVCAAATAAAAAAVPLPPCGVCCQDPESDSLQVRASTPVALPPPPPVKQSHATVVNSYSVQQSSNGCETATCCLAGSHNCSRADTAPLPCLPLAGTTLTSCSYVSRRSDPTTEYPTSR